MPTIKAKQGYISSFFQKVSVNNASFTAITQPDVVVNARGITNFSLSNETSGCVVEVSFTGYGVEDELDGSNSATKFLVYQNRPISTIWFRVKSGSSGPATVAVRAW